MIDVLPAEKRALSDEATDRLSRAIVTGRLKPGERINEGQIANLLQISRGPLREALAGLAGRGLVVKIANRGTFVVNFSLEDVTEVCSLRATLEQFAVRLLCQRPEPLDLQEMARLVSEMGTAAEGEDAERVISELDLGFHAAMVCAANHKRLFVAWNNLRPQIQMLLFSRNILNDDFRPMAVRGHQEILEALRQQDEALASGLLEEHLNFSYERLRQAYQGAP